MRELRTCDFCGGEAVGTFAVVPPELEPTEAEQRRVVCCSDCKDRLETLLEPLLARAGVDGVDATGSDAGDANSRDGDGESGTPTSDETDEETVVASSDESTGPRSRSSSPNASDPGADSGSDSALGQGITVERSGPADAGDESTANETGETPNEGSGDAATDGTATASANQAPKGYSKVIRLLQNREFPMKRRAVENLVAGAYDLESYEVEAIVDHAIEEGTFVEKRGKLRRSSVDSSN